MANGINFELRANELGIPATKHLGEVPSLSEPQHSLCKRWKSTGVMGELSEKCKDIKSAWHIVGVQLTVLVMLSLR